MSNVLIGAPIVSDPGVLYTPAFDASGDWEAGNPLTNLQDTALWKRARSETAAEIDTRLGLDLGTDRAVRLGFVAKHNLSSGAKWRLVGRASTTLFQYVAGEDLTARGAVFSRASTATYVDRAGVVRTAASGTPRDGHWMSGERTLLLEPASTNLCLRSEDFGTTWAAIGTPTRAAAAHTASGVTLDLIGDDDAGVLEGYSQTITFTADAVKAVSVFVKAGSSTSAAIRLLDVTAVANRLLATIAWSGGLPSVTAVTGTYLGYETLADGVFRLLFATTSVTAANTNSLRIYPATDAALAVTGTGTTYFGGVMAENATVPSSYIPTAAATVTRAADSLYFPFNAPPQAMTAYLRSYNVGAYISQTSAARVLHIGDVVGGTDPRFALVRVAASTGAQALYDDGVTLATSQASPSPTPALGNLIEHRGALDANFDVIAGVSVGGAAETTGSLAASGSAVAFANTRIYFAGQSESSNTAITHAVVAEGVKTMAECRTTYADSGWLDAWPSGWTAETAENLNLPLYTAFATAFSGRYWSLQISDPTNADGYLDLHRLALCGAYEPSVNFTTGAELTHESDSTTQYTRGGSGIHDARRLRRVTRFTIANVEDAEAIGQILRLSRQLGAKGQCVVVLRPDATADLLPETTFLAVPREQTRIEYPYALYRNAAFAFTEEL